MISIFELGQMKSVVISVPAWSGSKAFFMRMAIPAVSSGLEALG